MHVQYNICCTVVILIVFLHFFRVNYKFCPLCLNQISGAVLMAKSLQAVSFTFQNLARFVL
ncbi:hypothetical protein Hanom_Chr16g01451481 [Helianthus anomalus]